MSLIPHEATVPELIAYFKNSEFVSHGAIDLCLDLCPQNDLERLHTTSVELMARLDTSLQAVMAQLEKSLTELKRTENRIKYQTEMLQNDLASFSSEQARVLSETSKRVTPALNSVPLQRLSELSLAKSRMQQVSELIRRAQNFDEAQTAAELKRLISDQDWLAAEELVKQVQELVELWDGTNEKSSRVEFANSLAKTLENSKPSSVDYDAIVEKLQSQII